MPAGFDGRQLATLVGHAMVETIQAMRRHFTRDFDHVFLLDLARVGSQFADDFPVLSEHQKTTGIGL